jgi:TRAP-type C4-dicarboxylate transport system permease small subunit
MLTKPLRLLHALEDSILVGLLLALVLLSAGQIIIRNLGMGGFLWADPAGRILVLWLAMFGAMRASRLQNHISIDLINHYASQKVQQITHTLVSLSCAAICFVAFYYSFLFVQIEYEDNLTAYLNVPIWLCESIIPFSLGVIGLRFVIHSLKVPQTREHDA